MKAPRAGKTSAELAPPSQSAAEAHLFASDDRMGKLMSKVGPLGLTPRKAKSTFDSLTQSIVYQQLSGKAAATIHGRVCGLFERRRSRQGASGRDGTRETEKEE